MKELDANKLMNMSEKGLAMLREFEGCKLIAYQCQAGVWTIGVGHTATAKPGMMITTDQAMDLLRKDVEKFEYVVNNVVKVQLSQNQFDSLVSFVFNIGATAFKNSTLLKKLNSGDYAGAANQFSRWIRAGGIESNGLKKRRSIERSVFLGDNPGK